MELKRIEPGSMFKIAGLLYGSIGLVIGCLFTLAAMAGAGLAGLSSGDASAPLGGLIFGMGAIIFLPIFYGLLGAICAAIVAALYNLIARYAGGLRLQLE